MSDHDASTSTPANDPAAVEASGAETLDVTWRDFVVTVPVTLDEWDGDAIEALEGGRGMIAIRGALGSKQRDKLAADFETKHGHKPRGKDWGDLLQTIVRDGYGADLGE